MSDTKPIEFKFDVEKAKAHIKSIEEHLKQFIGKKDHNPFLWINTHLTPLVQRLEKGDTSKDLFDAILSLKKEAPVTSITPPEPPKKELPVVTGLKL